MIAFSFFSSFCCISYIAPTFKVVFENVYEYTNNNWECKRI